MKQYNIQLSFSAKNIPSSSHIFFLNFLVCNQLYLELYLYYIPTISGVIFIFGVIFISGVTFFCIINGSNQVILVFIAPMKMKGINYVKH